MLLIRTLRYFQRTGAESDRLPSSPVLRGFRSSKGSPLSLAPLFVKRDVQIKGLIHLISLAKLPNSRQVFRE